jgi:hypothetical protein
MAPVRIKLILKPPKALATAKINKTPPSAKASKTTPTPATVSKTPLPRRASKTPTTAKVDKTPTTVQTSKRPATAKTPATAEASKTPTSTPSEKRPTTRNNGKPPPERNAPEESWEELAERGKRRRLDEDKAWRRRDSVTHLVASIYADIEAAVEMQRRMAGTGNPLTEEERSAFDLSEDIRLDYLRELRLAAMFSRSNAAKTLRDARLPRGRRFESIRAARDIVSLGQRDHLKLLNLVVGTLGWTTIAICLHSANFRTRVLDLSDADDFARRLEELRQHRQSIKFFAKCRLLNWLGDTAEQQTQDILFRDLDCLRKGKSVPESKEISKNEARHAVLSVEIEIIGFPDGDEGIDHPHEWELSADGGTATRLEFLSGRQGASSELQRNIDDSVVLFHEHTWTGRSRWLLPGEPRYRSSYDDECQACRDEGDGEGKKWKASCQCSLENIKIRRAADGTYSGDRIELRHIHPDMGTGVRALQRFPAHALLAEYVGEIYPVNDKNWNGIYKNATYLYSQPRAEKAGKENAMYIDPSIHGNWTRYINHSCRPSTAFLTHSCGDKMLTCVTVGDQPIEFGEEITIDYGKNYFVGQKMACRCCEDVCKLWNADSVEDNKISLRQAKQRGVAPDWAK